MKSYNKRKFRKRKIARPIIMEDTIPIIFITALTVGIGSVAVYNIKNNDRTNEYIENGTTEYRTEEQIETTAPTTENMVEVTTESTTKITTEEPTEVVEFNDDLDFSKFEKASEWIEKENEIIDTIENTLIDDSKREEAKDTAKYKVIEYTDFIFYGTEIDGKTFDELTEEEKSKLYTKYQELINTVNEIDPNYIDGMSDKYRVIKDFGSLTLNNAKEKLKESLGEEYYNSASEAGEAVKEGVKDTGSLTLDYFKKKYEEWKDKDE